VTASPTQEDKDNLKKSIADELDIPVDLIRNFYIVFVESTQRFRQRQRHLLTSASWEVFFDVVVALGTDTEETTDNNFQSTVESSLSSTSFQISVINIIDTIVSFDSVGAVIVEVDDDDGKNKHHKYDMKNGSINFIFLMVVGSITVLVLVVYLVHKKKHYNKENEISKIDNDDDDQVNVMKKVEKEKEDQKKQSKQGNSDAPVGELQLVTNKENRKDFEVRGGGGGEEEEEEEGKDLNREGNEELDNITTDELFTISPCSRSSQASESDMFSQGLGVGRRFVLDGDGPQEISDLRSIMYSRTLSQTHSMVAEASTSIDRCKLYNTLGMGTSLDDVMIAQNRAMTNNSMTPPKSISLLSPMISHRSLTLENVVDEDENEILNNNHFEYSDEVMTTSNDVRFDNYACLNEKKLEGVVNDYDNNTDNTCATFGTSLNTPSLTTRSSSYVGNNSLSSITSFDSNFSYSHGGGSGGGFGSFDSTGVICDEPIYSIQALKKVYYI
jgi:hypothetical protein